jgi:hypothetical protein
MRSSTVYVWLGPNKSIPRYVGFSGSGNFVFFSAINPLLVTENSQEAPKSWYGFNKIRLLLSGIFMHAVSTKGRYVRLEVLLW